MQPEIHAIKSKNSGIVDVIISGTAIDFLHYAHCTSLAALYF